MPPKSYNTIMKIKKGDNIIVMSGKDKGKTGKIVQAFPAESRVLIEGINVRKVHERARKANQKGQIVQKAFPIHVSAVMLLDPKTNKPTRIGKKKEGDSYVRFAKKSGTILDK